MVCIRKLCKVIINFFICVLVVTVCLLFLSIDELYISDWDKQMTFTIVNFWLYMFMVIKVLEVLFKMFIKAIGKILRKESEFMSNTKDLSEKTLENKEAIVISTEREYKELLMKLGGEEIKLGDGGFINVFDEDFKGIPITETMKNCSNLSRRRFPENINGFVVQSRMGKPCYKKLQILRMFMFSNYEEIIKTYDVKELKEIINFIEEDGYDISDFILWDVPARDVLYFVNEKTNQEFVMTNHDSSKWKFAYEKNGALYYADTIKEAVEKYEK